MNKTATQVNAFIKDIEALVAPVVEAAVISACPALATPVVKQIIAAVEHALEDKLAKYAETGATFIVIDTQVGQENDRMGRAIAGLKRAVDSNDPEAIRKAQDEYDAAQSALANADGSAHAQ